MHVTAEGGKEGRKEEVEGTYTHTHIGGEEREYRTDKGEGISVKSQL